MVGGDTKQPDELADRLKDILFKTDYDQLDAAALERVKKKKIGGFTLVEFTRIYCKSIYTICV